MSRWFFVLLMQLRIASSITEEFPRHAAGWSDVDAVRVGTRGSVRQRPKLMRAEVEQVANLKEDRMKQATSTECPQWCNTHSESEEHRCKLIPECKTCAFCEVEHSCPTDGSVKAMTTSESELSSISEAVAYTPMVYYNGDWHPICGHHFWDNNDGATTFCKALGFTSGLSVKTRTLYNKDAMPVGKCRAGESLMACTAGANGWGDFNKLLGVTRSQKCKAGREAGVTVTCSGGSMHKTTSCHGEGGQLRPKGSGGAEERDDFVSPCSSYTDFSPKQAFSGAPHLQSEDDNPTCEDALHSEFGRPLREALKRIANKSDDVGGGPCVGIKVHFQGEKRHLLDVVHLFGAQCCTNWPKNVCHSQGNAGFNLSPCTTKAEFQPGHVIGVQKVTCRDRISLNHKLSHMLRQVQDDRGTCQQIMSDGFDDVKVSNAVAELASQCCSNAPLNICSSDDDHLSPCALTIDGEDSYEPYRVYSEDCEFQIETVDQQSCVESGCQFDAVPQRCFCPTEHSCQAAGGTWTPFTCEEYDKLAFQMQDALKATKESDTCPDELQTEIRDWADRCCRNRLSICDKDIIFPCASDGNFRHQFIYSSSCTWEASAQPTEQKCLESGCMFDGHCKCDTEASCEEAGGTYHEETCGAVTTMAEFSTALHGVKLAGKCTTEEVKGLVDEYASACCAGGESICNAPSEKKQVQYWLTEADKYCTDPVRLAELSSLQECAQLASASSKCGDIFYTDGVKCRCVLAGESCDKQDSAKGNNIYTLKATTPLPPAQANQFCTEGIISESTCCAASCGACGVSGCGSFPGGEDECCSTIIANNRNTCASASDVGCIIPTPTATCYTRETHDEETALGTSISAMAWNCSKLLAWKGLPVCTDSSTLHYDWAQSCPAHCAELGGLPVCQATPYTRIGAGYCAGGFLRATSDFGKSNRKCQEQCDKEDDCRFVSLGDVARGGRCARYDGSNCTASALVAGDCGDELCDYRTYQKKHPSDKDDVSEVKKANATEMKEDNDGQAADAAADTSAAKKSETEGKEEQAEGKKKKKTKIEPVAEGKRKKKTKIESTMFLVALACVIGFVAYLCKPEEKKPTTEPVVVKAEPEPVDTEKLREQMLARASLMRHRGMMDNVQGEEAQGEEAQGEEEHEEEEHEEASTQPAPA